MNIKNLTLAAALAFIFGCGTSKQPPQLLENPDSRVIGKSGTFGLRGQPNPGIQFTGGLPIEFEYISEILPINLGGPDPIQATSIRRIDQDHVVVTYNSAGASNNGGVDIISFNNPLKPKIVSSFYYNDREFSDVAFKDETLYLTGNDNEGALIQVIDAHKLNKPVDLGSVRLEGNTATSIVLEQNHAYVSSAEKGGLTLLNLNAQNLPTVATFDSLSSATFVDVIDQAVTVLGSSTNGFNLFQWNGGFNEIAKLPSFLNDSPARFSNQGLFLITNASNGTGSIYDHASSPGQFISVEDFALPGRGNGLQSELFVTLFAQGDAGLQWADHRGVLADDWTYPTPPNGASNPNPGPQNTVLRGAFDIPQDSGSANQVLIFSPNENPGPSNSPQHAKYILIADGKGGLRWVKFLEREIFRAGKTYNPNAYQNDVRYMLRTEYFKVPNYLKVISGNAGNHWARIEFDDVVCFYKGGSSLAKPPQSNSSEWNKGLKYNFHSCSDGSRPSDDILVQYKAELTVLNGNSDLTDTVVEVNLK